MSNFLVSVIVPAYNVEKYIDRGIESVLNQSYHNIELIIVDDGSTDGTGEIIKKYADCDKRIVYMKQENQGVSVARNQAIRMSKGDFLIFLDSDDWLELDTIEFLLGKAQGRFDTIVSSGCYFAEEGKNGIINKWDSSSHLIDVEIPTDEALLTIGTSTYRLSSSCYKLFPSRILKDNRIMFDEAIHNAEDGLFTFQCMKKAKRFIYSSVPKWNILTRPGSATTSPFNEKKVTALQALQQMLSDETNSAELNNRINKYYLVWCLHLLNECFNCPELPLKEIKYIRQQVKLCSFAHWPQEKNQKMLLFVFTFFPIKTLYRVKQQRKG